MKSVHTPQYERLLRLLVEIRVSAGTTQTDLARRLGRPQSFVSKYERGDRRLDVAEFLEVAHALDTKPVDLIEEIDFGFAKYQRPGRSARPGV